jgi:hypothetical protein
VKKNYQIMTEEQPINFYQANQHHPKDSISPASGFTGQTLEKIGLQLPEVN